MSDATQQKKAPEFKADLVESSKAAKDLLQIDAETGLITLKEGKSFADLVPQQTLDNLTSGMKEIDLAEHALLVAGTELAVESMKGSKLQQASYSIPTFGKNSMEAVFNRNGTKRGAPGSGEVHQVAGVISVAKHEIVSTRSKSEYQAIKANFSSLAEEAGL